MNPDYTLAYIKGLRTASKICFEMRDQSALSIANKIRERADVLMKNNKMDDLIAMPKTPAPTQQAPINCNGCTRCCQGDLIRLLPGDDPAQYQTMPHPVAKGHLALAHAPNGNCVYLTPTGCGIHDTKPRMCREMDCRILAMRLTFTQARKLDSRGGLRLSVWKQGKRMLTEPEQDLRLLAGRWMRLNAEQYENATRLAEDAVDAVNGPQSWLDDETHWIWEEAMEAIEYARQQ